MWFTGPEVLNLGASPSGGRYGISSWLGIFSQASYCWKNLEKNNSLEILFAWNAKIGIAISEKSSKLKPIWLGGHVGFLQGNVIMPGLFIGRSSHVSGDVYITEEKKRGNYWRDHAARCLPLRHGPCLRDRPNHLRTIEPQNQVSWCPQHRVTPTQSIYVTCCYVYYVYSVYETHFWKNILISMFQLMCCMSLSRHVK